MLLVPKVSTTRNATRIWAPLSSIAIAKASPHQNIMFRLEIYLVGRGGGRGKRFTLVLNMPQTTSYWHFIHW